MLVPRGETLEEAYISEAQDGSSILIELTIIEGLDRSCQMTLGVGIETQMKQIV